jgi:hypothetical protein
MKRLEEQKMKRNAEMNQIKQRRAAREAQLAEKELERSQKELEIK